MTFFLAAITSFFVVLFGTPSLIKVAKLKHLVDEPKEDRKLHERSIPTIGGIMIFSAFVFSIALWFPDKLGDQESFSDFKYLTASLIVLFFVGVKDDIIGTAPMYKLIAHVIVAFILVMMGDIRITNMHGLFGVYETIPEWGTILLSFFTYIVIVNAYNLIDGVDGLASGIGAINAAFFGIWFLITGQVYLAVASFALVGALVGFLVFNFHPARIFMGDSGSLTIGAVISVLAIQAIETPVEKIPDIIDHINTPIMAMAVLAYPLVDTLRVFTVRAFKGRSPFSADRNHLHHHLVDSGVSHAVTSIVFYIYSILVVGFILICQTGNPTLNFFLSLAFAFLLVPVLYLYKKKNAK